MNITRKPVGDEGLHVAPYTGLEAYRDGLEPAHQQYNHSLPQHGPSSSQLSKHEQYTDRPPRQKRKKLCGIPILAFWLLLAFIIALIAAIAVVGGLLGSSHVSSSKQTPTATMSAPPTTVTTTASAVSATGAFECTKNGTVFTSTTGAIFTTLCNQDLGMGKAFNNTFADLAVANVDSYGSCIDACALSRQEGIQWTGVSGSCTAVVWVSEGDGHGDCWMKNGTGKPHYNPVIYAALLQTS
jgi:hypothetical protein